MTKHLLRQMPTFKKIFIFLLLFVLPKVSAQEVSFEKKIQSFDSLYEKAAFAQAGILAEKYYEEAIIAQNDTLTARFSTLLSQAYLALNYTDGVEKLLKEALRIQSTENDLCIIDTYYTLGLYYLAIQKYDKARLNLVTSIKLLSGEVSPKFKSRALLSLGIVHENLNELDLAMENYTQALLEINKIPSTYLSEFAQLKIAGVEIKSGETSDAYEKTNRALEFGIKEGYPMLVSMAYKRLSDIFLKRNQPKEAIKYLQLHQKTKDVIFMNNQHQLFPLQKSDEVIENQKIIQTFKDSEAKNAKTIRNLYLMVFMGLSLIVLLGFLVLNMYRNNNIRMRNNEILRVKNQQLEIAKNKAEEIAGIRERFISTISHELRTPLYAVTGITHLLMKENPKPEQAENLESLKYSGEYLLALVNDILEINRLDSDKATVDFDVFNLKASIQQIVQSLQETAKKNQNTIHIDVDPKLPEKIMTDEIKINQVLHNLIGNAVKFTNNGDIWVRLKINWIKETSLNFTIQIEDTGIGIDEDYLENIFDNFSQGNTEINKKFGGTGLGLAIVKRILSLLDAEIKVKSKLGEGSTFYFDLTAKLSNGQETEEITHFDLNLLKGKKVLIVEDNRINQMITRKMVESVGMSCEIVDNGTKAVEMVKSRKYDGVLMDIHMPGISGIEATRYIRIFNTQIPIIALTALSLSEKRQELLACGIDDLLNKPFKPDEFFRKLFKLLV